jgi:phospholipid/cholesterol/gamma-HCH transport system substrate-binding protein
MKKIFSKEFIIGLSVIIAALVLFFGIEFLKGINLFRPANYYYAYYSNVDGLAVASPVQVNGYKVGQVREIIYDYADPGKIKVMLAMDKKLSIPADSYAEMGQTMLSGAYINLKIGKSAKKLAVGEEIPSGTSNGMMESISNEIMPAISQIMPKIDSLLSNLNTLVADPALLQSIQRLDGITANVLGVTEGLSNTMSRDVPLVVRDARSITHQIDSVSANLLALSKTLKQLPIATTMANVNDITANLSNFATKLNSSTSTLGRLTNDDELYHRLNQVSADIDSLIVDIKRNPKRYISIKLL